MELENGLVREMYNSHASGPAQIAQPRVLLKPKPSKIVVDLLVLARTAASADDPHDHRARIRKVGSQPWTTFRTLASMSPRRRWRSL